MADHDDDFKAQLLRASEREEANVSRLEVERDIAEYKHEQQQDRKANLMDDALARIQDLEKKLADERADSKKLSKKTTEEVEKSRVTFEAVDKQHLKAKKRAKLLSKLIALQPSDPQESPQDARRASDDEGPSTSVPSSLTINLADLDQTQDQDQSGDNQPTPPSKKAAPRKRNLPEEFQATDPTSSDSDVPLSLAVTRAKRPKRASPKIKQEPDASSGEELDPFWADDMWS